MESNEATIERPAKRLRLQDEAVPNEQLEKERRCGITEFLDADAPSFSGILKQRYTDFIVNEVQQDGTVLHLKSLDVPKAKTRNRETTNDTTKEQPSAPQIETTSKETPDKEVLQNLLKQWSLSKWLSEPSSSDNASMQAIESIMGPQARESLNQLADVLSTSIVSEVTNIYIRHLARESPTPVTTQPMNDRAQRTKAHQAIRQIFSSNLDSVTQDDGSIVISAIRKSSKRASQPSRQRHSRDANFSNPQQGEYLHFTVYKENRDTAEVKGFICGQLRLNPKRFEYAGTKDRRAVTTQRCSLYRMNVNQLHSVGKRLRGTAIGDFEYKSNGLRLGQTGGNEFTITLRNAHTVGDETLSLSERRKRLEHAMYASSTQLADHGFLNYFGLQRFGSFHVPTSTVGMKILQNDIRGAADAILFYSPSSLPPDPPKPSTPSANESNSTTADAPKPADDTLRALSIQTWREHGIAKPAITTMPKRFIAETLLIEHLSSRNGDRRNDFQGALMAIPRQTRTLYLHAYQSLVFNAMASLRWRMHGSEVVEGDVVLATDAASQDATMAGVVDESGEVVINPDTPASSYKNAKLVTAADLVAKTYTISDVVLPLPGHDVIYPTSLGTGYVDFMASAKGGGLDPHDMKRSWRDASLTGEYRSLIHKPHGVEASVRTYRGDEQLCTTDLEEIKAGERRQRGEEVLVGEAPVTNGIEGDHEAADAGEDAAPNDTVVPQEGTGLGEKKLAVIIKFKLGPGSFATMALRELMGEGMCKEHQPSYGSRK